MKAELRRFGESKSPVVVVDDFTGDLDRVLAIAESVGPYPRQHNYYPGVRRVITAADAEADAYVTEACEQAAQFIGGAFDVDSFDLVEASFSIVSTPPADLTPPQRAPHFDTTDQQQFALLHYLRVPPGSGTAFYRQRSTGIERVTEDNLATFVRTAQAEAALLPADSGYICGSDDFFEQIGAVEAVPDRLVIYQGSLLHSGIIPAGTLLTADPAKGRLTANLFVQGR